MDFPDVVHLAALQETVDWFVENYSTEARVGNVPKA